MKWLSSTVEGAGLARHGTLAVSAGILLLATFVAWLAASAFKVIWLGVFVGLGTIAFALEALLILAATRRRNLVKLWPEVIESIYSAVVSGLSLADAIDELALKGPIAVRANFQRFSLRLDSGWSFNNAIDYLKSEFGEVHSDRLCEVLRLVSSLGSEALASSLKNQAAYLREEFSVLGQIEAKQGWVLGTAKIAIAAPWLVVAMLSMRSENAMVYNSASGFSILLVGFLVSLFAYRLVQTFGALPSMPRVYQ